jgi:uncharacterized membrane protein YdjX (TVP38/TMEM64 family)
MTVAQPSPPASAPFLPRRLFPLLLLVGASTLFLAMGGPRYVTFAALAENSGWLRGEAMHFPVLSGFVFVTGYAGLTALSVPGGAIMSIAAGFLFGLWLGLIYVLVGATAGAGAIFVIARAGLSGLAERAGPRAARLKEGFDKNALSYLLVLRLIPLFPFWLVNIVAALAGMRFDSYVIGTFVGIIPGSLVYVSLGNGMGDIVASGGAPDLTVIFRPGVLLPILGLALLALTPVFYKRWTAV